MKVDISRVDTPVGISAVERLAREIWRRHFVPIIGHAQVEYMLATIQSARAIAAQIESGWEYYLAGREGDAIGYLGLVPEVDKGRMMLSKIYVKASSRGQGVGRVLLDFVETRSKSHGITVLWLTVNRFNSGPIQWYQHHGFRIVDAVKKDIGGGFFMDDHIMEKTI